MASDRTALDFSFVALVLDVNGRVRPDDLQSIPAVQRAQLLQSFFATKSASEPLHFEGDVLVRGIALASAQPPAAPAPAAAVMPAPVSAPASAPASTAVAAAPAPTAASAAPAAPAAPAGMPSAPVPFEPMFESSPVPATAAAAGVAAGVAGVVVAHQPPPPVLPSDLFSTPAPGLMADPFASPARVDSALSPPALSAEAPAPADLSDLFSDSAYPAAAAPMTLDNPFATPASAPAQTPPPSPMSDDFFTIPVPSSSGSSFFDEATAAQDVGGAAPAHSAGGEKVSFLFWLLPVLLTWVGGLVAFFVVRGKNPKQARAMLITGVALTVVYALIAVAVVFGLGLLAYNGVQNVQSTQVMSASTAPAVAADYPKWRIVQDDGVTTTQVSSSADPSVKARQDHTYHVTSPNGKIELVARYARTGASQNALAMQGWVNPYTVFKSTDGTSAMATSLYAKMHADHPGESLLGAYEVGKPKGKVRTYNVGFYIATTTGSGTSFKRGEHVYSYSASSGWKQTASDSKSSSAWNTTGVFK